MSAFNTELLYNDLLWLGSDKNGFLAVFPLGGSGPIPEVLTQSQKYQVEEIEFALDGLSYNTSAILMPNLDFTDTLEYTNLAKKGFYSYNFADFFGSMRPKIGGYELVAKPFEPLHKSDISGILNWVANTVVFENVSVHDASVINPEDFYSCLKADW